MAAGDRLELMRALISFQSLLLLDEAWTSLIEAPPQSGEALDGVLAELLGEMIGHLAAAQRGAHWLYDFVGSAGVDDIRGAFRDTIDILRRDDLRALDAEYGPLIGSFAQAGYDTIVEGLHDQFIDLAEKFVAVSAGHDNVGDLFKSIACSLAGLMFVGGAVATLIPPHIQGPIVAAAGVSCFGKLKCDFKELENGQGWRFV